MTGLGKYYNLERLFVEFGRDDFILRELGIGLEGSHIDFPTGLLPMSMV